MVVRPQVGVKPVGPFTGAESLDHPFGDEYLQISVKVRCAGGVTFPGDELSQPRDGGVLARLPENLEDDPPLLGKSSQVKNLS
jgi:hypothetical protein